jgi:hypothetical protein
MTAPVDVLAVLDRASNFACDATTVRGITFSYATNLPNELGEARDAVAELIEAAKMANGDHSAPHDCYATGPLTGDPVMDLVVCPGCRLAAALANVGGAK